MVFEAWKFDESVMRTVPPFVRIGSWASMRWLNHGEAGPVPPLGPA